MDFSILINWTSAFPILGVFGVLFLFFALEVAFDVLQVQQIIAV